MRGICRTVMLVGLLGFSAYGIAAQSSAESAATSSTSPPAAQSPAAPAPAAAVPEKQVISVTPSQPAGPPLEDKNRHQFEENAGESAAKLLLRSTPSGAEIFVNSLYVGHTPLLMVVAPGKYSVDMRGPRQEFEHSTVGVMPKETQTVLIKLNQRYPASLGVRWPGQ